MPIQLQTKVPIQGGEPKIDYHSKVVLLGSCFSENIGDKLRYFKFDAWSNPFGVIFNPHSLEQLIRRTVENRPFDKGAVTEREGVSRSFEVHSQWQGASPETLLNDLNAQRQKFREYLQHTTHCILTLGTAWVYRFKETHNLVANCHKVPGTEFEKELMPIEAIILSLGNIVDLLEQMNSNMKVIFTLSPVRHIKDGFAENNRSKGRLLDAILTVVDTTSSVYFPSYEIMMDELRDYRFYADDLLHPNTLGIDYIWERFQGAWIDDKALPVMAEVEAIQKGLHHRPLNSKSASHKEFQEQLLERIQTISGKYPHIHF